MAYQSQTDLFDTPDRMIGGLGIAFLFITVTAFMIGFVSQNTTIFQSDASQLILQALLGFGALFVLAIYANYRGLRFLQEHAYPIIKWCYLISMGLMLGFLVVIGLITLASGIGFIFIIIAAVIGFLFYRSWPWILSRIRRAADWLKIAATIVLNEPGMILFAIIQSIIIGITVITETVTLVAWISYADKAQLSGDFVEIGAYVVMFLYLWISLTVLYFFDGANTYMAYARIKGVDPKMGQGLHSAYKQFFAIMGYALISAIVYFITRLAFMKGREMSRKGDNMGQVILGVAIQIIANIVEFIYYYVSFFTLPAIIIRRKKTLEAMSESKKLFFQTFWDMIISDMGYSWGSMIMYLVTGLILSVGGFVYGYFVAFTYIGGDAITVAIVMAIIALIFGLFISKFFLKPLHTALITTMYVYATEGPAGLKIIPDHMKKYLDDASGDNRFRRGPDGRPIARSRGRRM